MTFSRFGRLFTGLTMLASLLVVGVGEITATTALAAGQPGQTGCKTWIHLIDISDNQPHPIVWWKVEKSGIAGAYIKATEGVQYVNEDFKTDSRNARRYGIPWGGYDFALPNFTNPIADAKFFVKAGGAKGELPPALDLETMGHGYTQTVKWVRAWMGEVTKLSHRVPILYGGYYFPVINAKGFNTWALWLAAYPHGHAVMPTLCKLPLPKTPQQWKKSGWAIWQYTDRVLVPGIGGGTDGDAADPYWYNIYTGAGFQPPSPTNPHAVPIYALGSRGVTVRYLQRLLVTHGFLKASQVNAHFNLATKAALEKYQHLIGVPEDGIWGPTAILANAWWNKYMRPAAFTAKLRIANYPILEVGRSNYPKVRQAQIFLRHAKSYGGKLDGIYGNAMKHGVSVFQHRRGIKEKKYGIIDYRTWAALWHYTH